MINILENLLLDKNSLSVAYCAICFYECLWKGKFKALAKRSWMWWEKWEKMTKKCMFCTSTRKSIMYPTNMSVPPLAATHKLHNTRHPSQTLLAPSQVYSMVMFHCKYTCANALSPHLCGLWSFFQFDEPVTKRYTVPLRMVLPKNRGDNLTYDLVITNNQTFSFQIVRKSTGTVM